MNFPSLKPTAGSLLLGVALLSASLPAKAAAPYSMTQSAAPVRATYATLNGMAVPRTNATTAWFEWGTDRTYGNVTAPQNIGSGTQVVRVSETLSNLDVGGVYHFRLVASNSAGLVCGFDSTFTTAMKVQQWGSFQYGVPSVPFGLTNLSGVAAGHTFALGLRNDGTVAAWMVDSSSFNFGQANVPPGLSNIIAVAGGFSHSLALRDDGTVVAWGKYNSAISAYVPVGLSNVIAIAAGDRHSVALKQDGTVVAWGISGLYGFEIAVTNVPLGLSNVVAISCGTTHTLALKADGTVSFWGTGSGSVSPPSGSTNLVAVSTMALWNIGLRANGTVVDWGALYYNPTVAKPSNLSNVVAVTTGYSSAQVLKDDGTLVGWGSATEATNIPPSLSNVVMFASGDYHRIGLAPVNLPPTLFSRSISTGVNTPLTVPMDKIFAFINAFDPNGDALAFRISSLPAKGSLYQYAINGLGPEISSPGTVVTTSNRVIFVPALDDTGVPYATFEVIGNDGEFDSNTATRTISVLPPPRLDIVTDTNPVSAFTLRFSGITNVTYWVERSPDRKLWTSLGKASQTSPGQFAYTDSPLSITSNAVYRVIATYP